MKRHYYYSPKRSIVYLNQQYLEKVFECAGADTLERQAKVKAVIQQEITDFLEGKTSESVLVTDSFVDANGNTQKAFEVYSFPDMKRVINLKAIKKLRKGKYRRYKS